MLSAKLGTPKIRIHSFFYRKANTEQRLRKLTIVNEGNFYLCCSGIVTGVPSVQQAKKAYHQSQRRLLQQKTLPFSLMTSGKKKCNGSFSPLLSLVYSGSLFLILQQMKDFHASKGLFSTKSKLHTVLVKSSKHSPKCLVIINSLTFQA